MAEPAKQRVPLVEGRLKILPDGKAHLVGIKCAKCSEIVFPKALLCPSCGAEDVEEVALSTRGKVWTYTIVHVGYGSIIQTPPYATAFVELEDGGYVHTPVVGCDPEEVSIGMDVELELITTEERDDDETVVYAFKRVST
jgi:hypothetical protein